jgi:hypothetical protein
VATVGEVPTLEKKLQAVVTLARFVGFICEEADVVQYPLDPNTEAQASLRPVVAVVYQVEAVPLVLKSLRAANRLRAFSSTQKVPSDV